MFGYLGVSLTRFISILIIKNTFYKKYGRKTVDNFSSEQKTKAGKVLQVWKYSKIKIVASWQKLFHPFLLNWLCFTYRTKVKMVTIHLKISSVSSNLLCILCKPVPIWSSKLYCYFLRRVDINITCWDSQMLFLRFERGHYIEHEHERPLEVAKDTSITCVYMILTNVNALRST